jgi:nitrate/nitrite-specific signal transduction histidine kinase
MAEALGLEYTPLESLVSLFSEGTKLAGLGIKVANSAFTTFLWRRMKMMLTKQAEKQTLSYKFVLLFALSSLLPLLLFLFVLDQYGLIQEPRAVLMLGMATLVAILGFFFFLRVVRQLAGLAQDFVRVEQGELEVLGIREGTVELNEMAHIADTFNRTLTELKDHTRELENLFSKVSTLSELTELVSRIPDIEGILQIILQRTMAPVNAKIGSIMILDDKTQALRIAVAEGLDQSVISDPTLPLWEGVASKVAQTGKPVLVEDVQQDSHFHKINDPKYETSSFVSMPLRAHLRILGVLNLSKKGDQKRFTESDMKFLTALLGHIGFALENAKLLEKVKESAIRLKEALEQQSQRLDQAHQQIIRSDKLSA